MSAALALLLQLAAPAPQPSPTLAPPPQDWSVLPPLRLVHHLPPAEAISDFVRDEVAAGRCVTATPGALSIDLAVQVGEDGAVRRIVPRAIDCPTVEQYAAGLASRFLRRNIGDADADSWHRLTLAFAW